MSAKNSVLAVEQCPGCGSDVVIKRLAKNEQLGERLCADCKKAPKAEARKVETDEKVPAVRYAKAGEGIRDLRTVGASDTTVTKLSFIAENPKRPGTDAHARFAKYSAAKTLVEYFMLGGTTASLKWDIAHGFVTVTEG